MSHWIKLLLKQNIILPDYQRSFVWDEERIQTLIDSLKNGEFVPPVTIGAYGDDNIQNLILDGQQRLTSVLLAYLSLFPKRDKFKTLTSSFVNDNDDEAEPEESSDNFMAWTFRMLTKKGRTKEQILENYERDFYEVKNWGVDEEFFKNTYIGFSFLVPGSSIQEQQKYYSTVFRNINKQGKSLLPQESRKSLYFLSQGYDTFFEPPWSHSVKMGQSTGGATMDFVRYLSLLFQYHKNLDASRVARGYKSIMESYYERFIYAMINDSEDSIFTRFSEVFPDTNYSGAYAQLEEMVRTLHIPHEYPSIIDMDVYFFGLIYVVLFEKKTVDIARTEELKMSLREALEGLKIHAHIKNPAALKYLRARITESITIYQRYSR